MFIWHQSLGELYRNGQFVASGYSGYGESKNKPFDEKLKGIGCIPAGMWNITDEHDSNWTGPYTLTLIPQSNTETYGRSDFRIHGDSIRHPGFASHGCIILPRKIREYIWTSQDRQLQVIA